MMTLNLADLAQAIEGVLQGTTLTVLTPAGVSIDTREPQHNHIFIALKGNTDGHAYVQTAFDKGAVLAITEQPCEGAHILVRDTSLAIKQFARFYKQLIHETVGAVPTIGITGSVGKTTTKDLTASIMAQRYRTVKTLGNFNNEIGLPLSVFCMDVHTQVAVLEMGMNNLGEIHRLAAIGRPDIAMITNIGTAHIENLGSRANIFKAKSELLDFEPKEVILDGDDDFLPQLRTRVPHARYYYLNQPERTYSAYNIQPLGLLGTRVTLKIDQHVFDVTLPIPGEYMIKNALAGAIAGACLGLTPAEIKTGIETFQPSGNRMDIQQGPEGRIVINDVYNASPSSMKATLAMLASQAGRKIAILGDMFELGDFAKSLHQEVGAYLAVARIDLLIAIGDNATYLAQAAEAHTQVWHYPTKQAFLTDLSATDMMAQFSHATLLVKASRGMGFETITERLLEEA